jgi:YegS/Rv2252/BmrU family lipid kinase
VDADRALLIANPTAGAGRAGEGVEWASAWLADRGWQVAVAVTEGPGHATDIARSRGGGFPVVVAAGGDGTAGEVANGLILGGHDPVVSVLPLGSASDYALNLGLRSRDDWCRAVESGIVRRVDAVQLDLIGLDGEPRRVHFTLTTGIGFSPRVIQSARPWVKRLFRAQSYTVAAILAAAGYRAPRMAWKLDGERAEGRAFNIVVANAPLESGGAPMSPGKRLDDGKLAVGILGGVSGLRGLWRMRLIFSGRHVTSPGYLYARAATVEVDSDPPVGIQVDGEVGGTTPARYIALPQRLQVLVPPDSPLA